MLLDHLAGSVRAEGNQVHDLFVDRRTGFFGVRPQVFCGPIANVADLVAHS